MDKIKLIGTVKWFSMVRGYGYIHASSGEDYWVHYSAIISDKKFKKLSIGQVVEFAPMTNEKGMYATEVKPIKEEV